MSGRKNKFDQAAIKNLDENKTTKRLFKRQPKLDRQKTYAELQMAKAKWYFVIYIFAVLCVAVAVALYHYYLGPYGAENAVIKNAQTTRPDSGAVAGNEIKAFFAIHNDIGATFGIVFLVFSILTVSSVLLGCVYWLFRCFVNIFKFGRNWFFWFVMMLFSGIPVVNCFLLIFILKKYKGYAKAAIANQTNLATANTISVLSQQQQVA